jgi:FkbM family methyltransferase
LSRIRFDRAISNAMRPKPGASRPSLGEASAESPCMSVLDGNPKLRRVVGRPLRMAQRAAGLAKRLLRRLGGPIVGLARRALLGPLVVRVDNLQQLVTALHVKQDAYGQVAGTFEGLLTGLHRKQDETHYQLTSLESTLRHLKDEQIALDAKLIAMRARIDDISIKVRGPIELDDATLAVRTGDGYAVVPRSDVALTAMLLDADVGGLEPGTRSVLRRLLKPGATFIDVGAHIGLLTIAGARVVGPLGKVFSFEASPDTFGLLERTVAINNLAAVVRLRSVAVGAVAEQRTFHVRNILGHSSLYDFRESDEGWTTRDVTVEVMPLDALVKGERVDVIKIDVEGAELDVLAGMTETLRRNPEVVLLTEFGPSHLQRTGHTAEQWFEAFHAHGLIALAIDEESGACREVTAKDVATVDSVNLAFVAPYSRAAEILK